MKIGFVGLGKMGSRMVEKLLADNHEVIVWNRSPEPVEELKRVHPTLTSANTIEELAKELGAPKIFWLMLPAGEATESILSEIEKLVVDGDIIIDGGNAFYKDTQRRFEQFAKKNVRYLGIGVSGGIIAAETGYPLMVGGNREAYLYIVPILESLARPNGGHAYVGDGAAGHFVKMIHNGIEYGQMQAIGEGFGVLEKSPFSVDLVQVAKIFQKGTIVSGFLIDRTKDALEKDPHMEMIEGVIAASGEADWTVDAAKEENVPIENIEQSLSFRKRSQTDPTIQNSFAAKLVAALRREFGGHAVKEKE